VRDTLETATRASPSGGIRADRSSRLLSIDAISFTFFSGSLRMVVLAMIGSFVTRAS
jgi:hypothetical protein